MSIIYPTDLGMFTRRGQDGTIPQPGPNETIPSNLITDKSVIEDAYRSLDEIFDLFPRDGMVGRNLLSLVRSAEEKMKQGTLTAQDSSQLINFLADINKETEYFIKVKQHVSDTLNQLKGQFQ